MKILRTNLINTCLGVFLAAVILGMGTLSFATMNHDNVFQPCFTSQASGQERSQNSSGNLCVEFHLGVLRQISQSVPQAAPYLFILFLFALAGLPILKSLLFSQINLAYFRSRLRHKILESKLAFYRQLGYWLVIIEKKNPNSIAELVQCGFVMS